MKKIDDQTAKVIDDIIREHNQAFELKGKKYKIVAIDDNNLIESTVEADIEKDPALKRRLLKAKTDIREKNYYTTEEMRQMIRNEQI